MLKIAPVTSVRKFLLSFTLSLSCGIIASPLTLAQTNVPRQPIPFCSNANMSKCSLNTPNNLTSPWLYYYDTEVSLWNNESKSQLMCWGYSDFNFTNGPSFGFEADGTPGNPAANVVAVGSLNENGVFRSDTPLALIGGRQYTTYGQCQWGRWQKDEDTTALALVFGGYGGRSTRERPFIEKPNIATKDPSYVTKGTDVTGTIPWSLTASEAPLPNLTVVNTCEDTNMMRMMIAYWEPLPDGTYDATKLVVKPVLWKDENDVLHSQCMIAGIISEAPLTSPFVWFFSSPNEIQADYLNENGTQADYNIYYGKLDIANNGLPYALIDKAVQSNYGIDALARVTPLRTTQLTTTQNSGIVYSSSFPHHLDPILGAGPLSADGTPTEGSILFVSSVWSIDPSNWAVDTSKELNPYYPSSAPDPAPPVTSSLQRAETRLYLPDLARWVPLPFISSAPAEGQRAVTALLESNVIKDPVNPGKFYIMQANGALVSADPLYDVPANTYYNLFSVDLPALLLNPTFLNIDQAGLGVTPASNAPIQSAGLPIIPSESQPDVVNYIANNFSEITYVGSFGIPAGSELCQTPVLTYCPPASGTGYPYAQPPIPGLSQFDVIKPVDYVYSLELASDATDIYALYVGQPTRNPGTTAAQQGGTFAVKLTGIEPGGFTPQPSTLVNMCQPTISPFGTGSKYVQRMIDNALAGPEGWGTNGTKKIYPNYVDLTPRVRRLDDGHPVGYSFSNADAEWQKGVEYAQAYGSDTNTRILIEDANGTLVPADVPNQGCDVGSASRRLIRYKTGFTNSSVPVLLPGDVIINEYSSDNDINGTDFIELLVLGDDVDLRGLRISDNELINGVFNTNESFLLFGSDAYLSSVPKGTTIAVYTNATGVTTDIVTNPEVGDWKLVLAPGTGITLSTVTVDGTTNAGLSTGGEAIYVFLTGPDGTSGGTDNLYLDFMSYENDGADPPTGFADINLPSIADNAYYIGNTPDGNNEATNWVRYDGAPPNGNATPGEPNPGQDLSELRTGLVVIAPSITTQPASTTIDSGQSTTLSVIATGTDPLSYQWYQGDAGDTSIPVGTNSDSFTTPILEATTNYWVQVTNTAGTINSTTTTVTVLVVEVPPSITTQPVSTSISSGQSTTLSVIATGTDPLSYQWYQGDAGDTSIPVGTNSDSFTTPILEATTNYWVQVTNTAGIVNSTTAIVTVLGV